MLEHKHLIINARVNKPLKNTVEAKKWFKRLIAKIDMEILMGPYASYSEQEGNRGLTAVAIITTSHIAAHFWDEDEPGVLQLDIYSCKDFNIEDVFDMIAEFEPTSVEWHHIDRNGKIIDLKRKTPFKRLNDIINNIWSKING